MIFPFERDKERDEREGRMDGGRFGERGRAQRDSGKRVMERVEGGGEGRRQVGSGKLGKEWSESDGGRRLVQLNTWTVERGGLWFKKPSPKDQKGPHTHFHCYYKSVSLSLPLIQTLCLFLTPTCMYLLSRIGAQTQTAIISSFHVTVLKQKQIITSSIYPPHLCCNFHELLGRKFTMKPNLGEMVGGETWATRTTDTVGGEWTLGELQLSSGHTLELYCLSHSLQNILFKFSSFHILKYDFSWTISSVTTVVIPPFNGAKLKHLAATGIEISIWFLKISSLNFTFWLTTLLTELESVANAEVP